MSRGVIWAKVWGGGAETPKALRLRQRRGIEVPKAPREVGSGDGVLGGGLCPLPRKILRFLYGNNAFWCIFK